MPAAGRGIHEHNIRKKRCSVRDGFHLRGMLPDKAI
jgi:hypothetical protein